MPNLSNTIKINAPAQKAWDVVGDLGSVHRWVEGIASCRVDGNRRYCTMTGIGDLNEDISDYSPERRSYRYRIPALPLPVQNYRGLFRVDENGAGSVVVWEVEFEAKDPAQGREVAKMIDGVQKRSLETLRGVIES